RSDAVVLVVQHLDQDRDVLAAHALSHCRDRPRIDGHHHVGAQVAVVVDELADLGVARGFVGRGVLREAEQRGEQPPHRYAANTSAKAMTPGSAWTRRILRFAVKPPNTPATITQERKNTLIANAPGPGKRPQA